MMKGLFWIFLIKMEILEEYTKYFLSLQFITINSLQRIATQTFNIDRNTKNSQDEQKAGSN